ncbi:M20/M25/M40 family metallo-hydrolase [Agrococcus sp. Marseille-P2731]|uniref:M20/M25/M40 family metallo-hydrolase n=1 Tax=Agrococcus sp. Marseille-P2731 TaxID=1841862 RepID=UPI001F413399|nr:M20/M25/M40 family metallo-hydrolase [Agrococcus sp. Marseille-P2731]
MLITDDALDDLIAAIRVPTETEAQIPAFQALLRERFPRLFAELEVEAVGSTLLARWAGIGDGAPALLMAHQDVVPAPEAGAGDGPAGAGWTHPPYSGHRDATHVWGRGTLDDKGSLVGICVAIEALLERGFRPQRDVWLVFGHDEETMGTGAASAIAELDRRGVRPAWALDEGGAIIEPPIAGVARDVAVVGVAEKGFANVRMRVAQVGGHASTPPALPATSRLARAIRRLDFATWPRSLPEPALRMLELLGAEAAGAQGAVLRNVRRTRPIVERILARSDETRAMLSTTAVVTQLSGAAAANALAEEAVAVVNARIALGSTVDETLARIRRAVADDAVELTVLHGHGPSPESPASGVGWEAIEAAIGRARPDVLTVPYVMLGGTDGRHAHRITDRVYRFAPFEMTREERLTLHARDERIRIDTWLAGCRWYADLIETSC